MAAGKVLAVVVLLACVSQLEAVRSCNAGIRAKVEALRQAPVSYIDAFSGLNAWLVAANPDKEFGHTNTYYLHFNQSCGNSVTIYISQTFLDGTGYDHTHVLIKENFQDFYYEPGYDLKLNFFMCSDDLFVGYKCQDNANDLDLFLILAPYGKTAEQLAVDACIAQVRTIVPHAQFKKMNYPRVK